MEGGFIPPFYLPRFFSLLICPDSFSLHLFGFHAPGEAASPTGVAPIRGARLSDAQRTL